MAIYNPIANLFGGSDQRELVSKLGDPLEKLNEIIDWERFRPILEEVYPTVKNRKGGRPRMNPVMMMKVLILQKLYNLSDHGLEFQLADRMSFQRFLGITSIKAIPDEKTIWLFREQAKNAGLVDRLFDHFVQSLRAAGLIANEGKIVDASIVEAPRQRNSREENQKIKSGEEIEDWNENPNKLRQKDVDASWTKKHGKTYYGYKDHIKVDAKSKLIEDYEVGTASEHDSQVIDSLTDQEYDRGQSLWVDSAYRSDEIEEMLKGKDINSEIHHKGKRGKPLNKKQKGQNTKKSKTRARVEHVFGYMHQSMGGLRVRAIGIERAAVQIGLSNLTYNFCRSVHLITHQWRGISVQVI